MFTGKCNEAKLSKKVKFATASATDFSRSDWSESEVTEAFEAEGVRGIMRATGLGKSQAYLLTAKFDLMRKRAAKKDDALRAKRLAKDLEHLKKVWGWKPGDDRMILTKSATYPVTGVFHAGNVWFHPGDELIQYILPTGKARAFLILHGLRFYVVGTEKIPVRNVRANSLSLKG